MALAELSSGTDLGRLLAQTDELQRHPNVGFQGIERKCRQGSATDADDPKRHYSGIGSIGSGGVRL